MAGGGPNEPTTEAKMAAPVGVVSSPLPPVAVGNPRKSAAVAGAGTGINPCAVRIVPDPSTGGDDVTAAGSSHAMAAAAPTMSAMESHAPTS